MILSYHDAFKIRSEAKATRLVIKDRHGQPLLLAFEAPGGQVITCMNGDPRFEHYLQTMGEQAGPSARIFDLKEGDVTVDVQ